MGELLSPCSCVACVQGGHPILHLDSSESRQPPPPTGWGAALARPQSLPDPSRQSTFLIFQGPCHRDLHEVLGRLSEEQQSSGQLYRFYLPNCSKNGFYHSRQVRALPRAILVGTVLSRASLQNPAFLAGEGASPKYAP